MTDNKQDNKKISPALQKTGNVLLHISRFVLGGVFIFSGFVKAIDPLGFTYKIEDYLHAFGGIFDSFAGIAFSVAVLLSTLELLIGLNLIFKVQLRLTSLLALLFMAVMTPLTLYIAIKNPVTDCGCFGDALVISNWATFYKNLFLITLAILMLIFHKRMKTLLLPRFEWIAVTMFILIGVGLSLYSYQHLPLIDFRPYKVGVNIPEAMLIPEGAVMDKYSTTLFIKKTVCKKSLLSRTTLQGILPGFLWIKKQN